MAAPPTLQARMEPCRQSARLRHGRPINSPPPCRHPHAAPRSRIIPAVSARGICRMARPAAGRASIIQSQWAARAGWQSW